jgi:hypothetical protein
MPDNIEAAIIGVLEGPTNSGTPLKARIIARILSGQFGHPFLKRQINPLLYRMRAEGRLNRDEYFRWSVQRTAPAEAMPRQRPLPPGLPAVFHAEQVTPPSISVDSPTPTTVPEAEIRPTLGFAVRTYGQFSVSEESRPNERHCTWCADKIQANALCIVVRMDGKQKAKFDREECRQNWESIYWQRVSLNRSKLTRKAFLDEQRAITRQKRFLGYGW